MAVINKPSDRNLRIRKATPADVPDLVRVQYDAFGPGVMNRLMFPDGGSEDARAKFGKGLFPEEGEDDDLQPSSAASIIIMVAELLPVAEGEQPEIVAYGKWRLVKEPVPEAKWSAEDKPLTAEVLGEGSRPDVFNAFIGSLHRMGKKWRKGDPILCKLSPHCTVASLMLKANTFV